MTVLWLIPLYTAGCAVHAFLWNRAVSEAWEIREGGLTRSQFLLKDWNLARLIFFVPLWPLAVALTVCIGIRLGFKEMY